MASLDAACLRMDVQLSSWQLCSLSQFMHIPRGYHDYSFGSVSLQVFPSKILLPPSLFFHFLFLILQNLFYNGLN